MSSLRRWFAVKPLLGTLIFVILFLAMVKNVGKTQEEAAKAEAARQHTLENIKNQNPPLRSP
jgi:bacteriorhodopsin